MSDSGYGKAKRPLLGMAMILTLVCRSDLALALSKEFMYDSTSGRDPFLPLIGQDVEIADISDLNIGELKLEGIIYDPAQGSLAMINGEVYRQFEFIGGFEVREIREDEVRLYRDNNTYTLTLPQR